MSWLFQILSGCQPKSAFLSKTRGGKSQLVCTDFYLLKGSRYRLTSAQYLILTSLEMGAYKWVREYCLVPLSCRSIPLCLVPETKKGEGEKCVAFCGNIRSELFTFSFQECSDRFWKHVRNTRPGTLVRPTGGILAL